MNSYEISEKKTWKILDRIQEKILKESQEKSLKHSLEASTQWRDLKEIPKENTDRNMGKGPQKIQKYLDESLSKTWEIFVEEFLE